MTYALVTGTLFRAPEPRVAKSGKSFVSATLKVKNGDSSQFWSLLAFGEEPKAELMRLGNGDAVAAQGLMKVENSEHNGASRISLTRRQNPCATTARRAQGKADARHTQPRPTLRWHRGSRSQ